MTKHNLSQKKGEFKKPQKILRQRLKSSVFSKMSGIQEFETQKTALPIKIPSSVIFFIPLYEKNHQRKKSASS